MGISADILRSQRKYQFKIATESDEEAAELEASAARYRRRAKEARERATGFEPDIRLLDGDAAPLDFPDEPPTQAHT